MSEGFLYIDQQNVVIGGDGLKFSLGGAIANTDFLILLMLLGYRFSPHQELIMLGLMSCLLRAKHKLNGDQVESKSGLLAIFQAQSCKRGKGAEVCVG